MTKVRNQANSGNQTAKMMSNEGDVRLADLTIRWMCRYIYILIVHMQMLGGRALEQKDAKEGRAAAKDVVSKY